MTSLPNPFFAPAEGVAIVTLEEIPVPVVAVASDSRACASQAPGPSLATGMSRDPANAGGEHEEVAKLSTDTAIDEKPTAITITSLNADAANLDDEHSGTAPAASGPERVIFGAPNSIPPIGPGSPPTTGPTTAAGKTSSAPAAFSFQPDFEKLFSTIFELTDMQAVLICAEEELRAK